MKERHSEAWEDINPSVPVHRDTGVPLSRVNCEGCGRCKSVSHTGLCLDCTIKKNNVKAEIARSLFKHMKDVVGGVDTNPQNKSTGKDTV